MKTRLTVIVNHPDDITSKQAGDAISFALNDPMNYPDEVIDGIDDWRVEVNDACPVCKMAKDLHPANSAHADSWVHLEEDKCTGELDRTTGHIAHHRECVIHPDACLSTVRGKCRHHGKIIAEPTCCARWGEGHDPGGSVPGCPQWVRKG